MQHQAQQEKYKNCPDAQDTSGPQKLTFTFQADTASLFKKDPLTAKKLDIEDALSILLINSVRATWGKKICNDQMTEEVCKPIRFKAQEEESEKFAKMSEKEFSNEIARLEGQAGLKTFAGPSALKVSYYLNQFFVNGANASNDMQLENYLSSIKDKLTEDEKDVLIGATLARLKMMYEDERKDQTYNPTVGHISGIELLNKFKSYQMTPSGDITFGVCRDHHLLAAKMARALGKENVVLVSYGTRKGWHVNISYNNKGESKKLTRFNYAHKYEKETGSVASMHLGANDVATNYRYFNPDGKMIKEETSKMGQFLHTAAGFDVDDIEPLNHATSSIAAANMAINLEGSRWARIGAGVDGTGARYLFAGFNQTWNQKESRWPGKVGLVLGTQNVSDEQFLAKDSKTANLDFVYGVIQQEYKKEVNLSPSLQLKINGLMIGMVMVGRDRSEYSENEIHPQFSLRGQVGADLHKKFPSGELNLGAKAQVVPGIKDVSDVSFKQMPIAVLNQLVFTAEGRKKLAGMGPSGQMYLIAATTVLLDNLGPKARAQLGLAGEKVAGMISVEGRLRDKDPNFSEGSGKKIGVTTAIMPSEVIKISIGTQIDLDQKAIGGSATGEVKF